MNNSLLLSINIGLLLSYIFTYYCHGQIISYTKDLSLELMIKYNRIKKERILHFYIGILLSMLISYLFYLKAPQEMPLFQKINIILIILLLLPMVVYKLLPKSDHMLNYSQTDQDYKDWFNIYLCMKNKSMYGFLCGFTVSIMLLSLMEIK